MQKEKIMQMCFAVVSGILLIGSLLAGLVSLMMASFGDFSFIEYNILFLIAVISCVVDVISVIFNLVYIKKKEKKKRAVGWFVASVIVFILIVLYYTILQFASNKNNAANLSRLESEMSSEEISVEGKTLIFKNPGNGSLPKDAIDSYENMIIMSYLLDDMGVESINVIRFDDGINEIHYRFEDILELFVIRKGYNITDIYFPSDLTYIRCDEFKDYEIYQGIRLHCVEGDIDYNCTYGDLLEEDYQNIPYSSMDVGYESIVSRIRWIYRMKNK